MATMSIIDQIMELEAKKQELMTKAKTEALTMAEKAVADLNSLGFHYRLVEGNQPPAPRTREATTTRGPRRGGVAEQVLDHIKKSESGLSRAQLLSAMGAEDKSAQQSISNALSNLKKKGELTAANGVYKPA